MKSGFWWRVVMFAALFWLVYEGLSGVIFLFSHLPPQWVHLDWLLKILGMLSRLLTFPRRVLRHFWPAETTPTLVLWVLAIANWLLWGLMLAGARKFLARGQTLG